MKTFVLSSFAAFLLMLVACKKSADQTAVAADQHYTIDSLTLSYLKLPIGTCYAYKDSATGLIDTVVVKKSEITTLFIPSHTYTSSFMIFRSTQLAPDTYFDSLKLQLTKESINGSENWLSINYEQNYFSVFFYGRENKNNWGNTVFWNPTTKTTGHIGDGGVYIIPSITIEGNTYKNVLRFVDNNSADTTLSYYSRSDYYWAQGVGVIKRSIKNSKEVYSSTLLRTWK